MTRVLLKPMLAHSALLLAQTAHEHDLYVELGAPRERVKILPLPLPELPELPEKRRLPGERSASTTTSRCCCSSAASTR